MRYIRTKLGTNYSDAPESSLLGKFVEKCLEGLNPNPDYDHSLVCEWLIELDGNNCPGREIGLDSDGSPVLAGPNDRNYGFWHDTNMLFDDFEGSSISPIEFNEKWDAWVAMRKSN